MSSTTTMAASSSNSAMTKPLVFIPAPAIGQLVSFVEFAKQLVDRDNTFSITMLLMSRPFAHDVSNFTNILTATHPGIQFIVLPVPDFSDDPPPLEDINACPEHFASIFIAQHKALVKNAIVNHVISNNSSVSLAGLVLDLFCSAFVDVAHELDIPSYVFFAPSASFLGFMFYLTNIQHDDKVGSVKFEAAYNHDYLIPSYVNPVPCSVFPSVLFHSGGSVSFPNLARRFKKTKGIIVNTFSELESHAVASLLRRIDNDIPPIYTVGPIIDHKAKNLSPNGTQHDKIMRWLDDQPSQSVVFLCFGSQGSFGETQLKEIAIGLEQSGQRFLWSIRKPPSKYELNPGEFSNYDEILPDGFLSRTKDMGLVCGWAPQVEVLGHKAVGAFVSHCGWNSALESIWHGVPIVAWPLYAEQQLNAFFLVKELGLAVELKMDYRKNSHNVITANEIAKSVKYVMEDDSQVRNKVKELSKTGRQAVTEGGSSFAALGSWIQALNGKTES